MVLLKLIPVKTDYLSYRFTFHYGSSKTESQKRLNGVNSDLHSTMVLLKLVPLREIVAFLIYLHSTMVLLKPI